MHTPNSVPAQQHGFGAFLRESGFVLTPLGYQMRRPHNVQTEPEHSEAE